MKSHLDYLLELKEKNKLDEIRDTWAALGSLTVSNKTKVYVKDTLFQVFIDGYVNSSITPSDLHMALVYCSADYRVNNDDFPIIDWENVSIMDIEGRCSLIEGITSPHFRVILSYSDFISITSTVNDNYLPYQTTSIDSEISISDDELEIILGEVGVPFLRIEELEYTKEKILNNCIKPALQEYYKYFPIVDQQELGGVGGNVEYEFELPKYCYAVTKAFIAQSSGAAGGGTIGKGAYNYMMQTTGGMGMGNGGAFGRGVSYRGKAVPGYVGGSDYMSAYLMQRAAQQAMTNYAKREKFRYVRKDKKLYIAGFSSIGGILCVSFAKWSPVWDDVRFDQLNNVRNLCTSYVLQNLGMLRSLVKTDIPGNIDYSLYTNRAEKLRDDVLKFWASLPTNIATVIRGEM